MSRVVALAVKAARILALILALVGAAPTFSRAQIVDSNLWVTDGPVQSVVPSASTLYIGGDFNLVGPATGAAVAVDAGTAAAQEPYPLVTGTVYAVAPDGLGGWYIGGNFQTAQSRTRRNLAHVNAVGQVTAWNPNANGIVRAIHLVGSTVYVGGDFSNVGGQSRNFLAALSATTGAATAWNPNSNAPVRAFASTGSGNLFAGGDFTTMGGVGRSRLAAFDLTTGALAAFNPGANGSVLALEVRFLSAVQNRLYVGGQFTTLGGLSRSNIGVLDFSGAVLGMNPGANGTVYAIRAGVGDFLGHSVYAAGDFTTLGGAARSYLGAFVSGSGLATAWNPGANAPVWGLGYDGSTVYAGGSFTALGGQPRNQLAAIDAAGLVTAWNPSSNEPVTCLAVAGTRVYAGGMFTSVGCVTRNNIAALDLVSGAATAWDPNVNNSVWSMALRGDTLYVGGQFTQVSGVTRNRAAAVHAQTGALTSWNPNSDGVVFTMLVHGGSIRAGGSFLNIGGAARSRIAGLDPVTGTATAWQPNANNSVFTMALRTRTTAPFTTTIFAAGLFSSMGFSDRSRVAELNPTTGAVTAWNPPVFDNSGYQVTSIVPMDPFIFVGGSYYSLGGQSRTGLCALYNDTGQLSGWNANTIPFCQVYAMAEQGGTLYTGGFFASMGGQPRQGMGAINAFSAVATNWTADVSHPQLASTVNALAIRGATVYVGGQFTSIAGSPHSGIAALTETPTAVAEQAAPALQPAMVTAEPNPSVAGVTLRFSLPQSGAGDVAVYNLAGRRVRQLRLGQLPAGQQQLLWDGRDESGRAVGSGVYFVRVRAPGFVSGAKLVRMP